MTFSGVNFRSTLGFVTDGPNDVWCGPGTANTYASPPGYGTTGAGGTQTNISNTLDPRIAGTMFFNGSPTFRYDVPNGPYKLRLGIGHFGGGSAVYGVRVRTGAGSTAGVDYQDIFSASAMTGTQVADATGAVLSATDWPTLNQTININVTRGFINIDGGISGGSRIKHFALEPIVANYADATITDDTHVAATTPVLMEAQPNQKVLCFLDFSVGSASDTDYTITQADGVTADPYLTLRTIGSALAVCYNGTRHPGTGPTRTFYLVQTDKTPGGHSNSPYKQTITLNVVAAPAKPFGDGTILSKISTAAFLARQKVIDKITAPYTGNPATDGIWPGYQGQSFQTTTTVYTVATLQSAVMAAKALAGTNKWFCIELDTNGTSDWATSQGIRQNGGTSGDWSFKPELGGGLLIRNKAGGGALILGQIYVRCLRGVHFDNITIASDGGNSAVALGCIRYDGGQAAGGEISLWKLSNSKLGFKHNPAYSSVTPSNMDITKGVVGVFHNGLTEQFIAVGNQVYGASGGFLCKSRLTYISGNDVAYAYDDSHALNAINPADAALFPDIDQYTWLDGNVNRAVCNVANGQHSDWIQQRTNNFTNPGTHYLLVENNIVHKSFDTTGVDAQLTQLSDNVKLSSTVLNNIFASEAPRGWDLSNGTGVQSFIEYNSFGPPSKMIHDVTQYAQQKLFAGSGSSIMRGRKNVLYQDNAYPEDEKTYTGLVSGGQNPNSVMTGTFVQDPDYNAAGGGVDRWAAAISDDPFGGVDMGAFQIAMRAMFAGKSGVDAGFQPDAVSVGTGKNLPRSLVIGIGIRL